MSSQRQPATISSADSRRLKPGARASVHDQTSAVAARTHPRWPEITRYMRHGACHAGRGHLLGSRRAIAAEGVYSFCTPGKVGALGEVRAEGQYLWLWQAGMA